MNRDLQIHIEEEWPELPAAEEPSSETDTSSLDSIYKEVSACTKCPLHKTRTNPVFDVGNRNSPLIAFVGEGPGEEEDKKGEPFVGKAGKLLTDAITKGLKLPREDVYICNAVKCRPPENRNPTPDELDSCYPYLEKQLLAVQPQVIIVLGSVAQKALLGRPEGITKLRGKWFEWNEIPVLPTWHPAYILRNPSSKRTFWEDLQTVMKKVGLA